LLFNDATSIETIYTHSADGKIINQYGTVGGMIMEQLVE
jgi:hypothetical protein